MADTKISDFGDIPVLDLTNDRVPILDVSGTGIAKNKLIAPDVLMGSKLDLAGGTMTGQLVLQLASATGAVNVSPTWNDAGTNFVGIYGRVTNTASGASSKLLDLGTVAGGSLFNISKVGGFEVDILGSGNKANFEPYSVFGLHLKNGTSSVDGIVLAPTNGGLLGLGSIGKLFWSRSANATDHIYGPSFVSSNIEYIGTGILGLRNADFAQEWRVFGATTGNKYASLKHNGTNASLSSSSGDLHISSLPTSNPGPGILWNSGGTPAIGT